MKKDKVKPQETTKKVKVIRLVQEGSAYGYQICEVDESALVVEKKSEPEVFYIFLTQLENAARDLFGI
jgi:hypothetical protein